MAFQKVARFNSLNQNGNSVDNVQSGSISLPNTSVTVAITSVVLNKAVLVFTYTSTDGGDTPIINHVLGKINSTIQIEFVRNSTTSDIEIQWFVIEFKATAPATVQRGVHTDTFSTVNIPISSIDTDHSFPIISWNSNNGTLNDEDNIKAEIMSSVLLNIKVGTGVTTGDDVAWQVVENSNWTVDKYNFSINSSTADLNETITSVDESQTMTFATAHCDNGDIVNGEQVPTYFLNSATTFNIYRSFPTFTWEVTAYIVTGPDIFGQHEFQDFSTTFIDWTITSVDTSRSIIMVGSGMITTGANNDTANAGGSHIYIDGVFQNSTTVRWSRISSAFEVTVQGQAIQFS